MKLPQITAKQILQTIQLAFIYVIFSIPLITMGAATCAAYYVSLKIINKTPDINIFSLFFKSFTQNFLQGTLMWILTVGIIYLLTLFWQNLAQNNFDSFFKIILAIILSLFGVMLVLYSFPTIARYTNKFTTLLRNSAILSIQFYTYSFSLLIKLFIIYFLAGFLTYFIPPLFFVCFIILPITTVMIISPITNKIFSQLEKPQEESTIQENTEEPSEN